MRMPRLCAVMLVALILGLVPAACGGEDPGRGTAEQDALDREMDMALEKDISAPTFRDTALSPEPARPPAASRAEPSKAPASKPAVKTQPPATPSAPRLATLVVPTGTTFAVHLEETLATDQNQVGDPFTARLSDPLVDRSGQILLPAGATIRGRVTGAEKSDRVGDTAVITLAFESVSFEGKSFPLLATVVEASPERKTRTTRTQSAGKIAAGAAAGAVVGQVLGKNRKSTVTGAVVGAAAGTAIALGTADVDAVLPAGSRMVIRLDAPVEVQRMVP